MALVETVIDGRKIEVERDRWALEVAREMGISIPTLCYHPALEPYGACRLCVVEVTRGKWTWLTTACDLPIREGLAIRTDTPGVMAARRMALELVWAEAPDAVEVQELAREYGVQKPRFKARAEGGKCILCGLCVRVCKEIFGEAAICFSRRGTDRRVISPFEEPSGACIGCGACISVCPTGAVEEKLDGELLRMVTWRTDLKLAECECCGRGFASERIVQWVTDRAGEVAELVRLCPSCRSRRTVRTWREASNLAISAGTAGGERVSAGDCKRES